MSEQLSYAQTLVGDLIEAEAAADQAEIEMWEAERVAREATSKWNKLAADASKIRNELMQVVRPVKAKEEENASSTQATEQHP